MRINLSRVHFPIRALGPGARLGIWFQGCSIRCPGCISMDTWAEEKGATTVERVMDAVRPSLALADGVTISGGEPFDQADALFELLEQLRTRHSGDVLVYSGHRLEELQVRLPLFAGRIDALIADPFRADLPQTRALRGSDNQRLVCLTPLGRERFAPYVDAAPPSPPQLDIMFDDASGEVFMAGIPPRGGLQALSARLALSGHSAITSDDKRSCL